MDFSLVGGPFVWSTVVVALGILAWSIRPYTWHRARLVFAVAVVSGVGTVIGLRTATSSGWIQPALPLEAVPWVWAVVFAVVWAPIGWRSARIRGRLTACLAVPLCLMMALVLFNGYFFYYPTFATLVGSPALHQASADQVEQIELSARLRSAEAIAAVPVATRTTSHGITLPFSIPPTVSHFSARSGWVYLPPAWFGPRRRSLPVIFLLEGTPTAPEEWLRGAYVDRYEDAFASRHDGMGPVLVMVDENGGTTKDSECVDRAGSNAETYVVVDARRAVVHQFDVTNDPRRWGVAGLSEGGLCALDIATRHPREFRVMGDFSGESRPSVKSPEGTLKALFDGDRRRQASYDPNLLMRHRRYDGMHAMFVVGDRDGNRASLLSQAEAAHHSGMNVEFRLVHGAHTFWVWRTAFREFLPFAWHALEPPTTPRPSTGHPTTGHIDTTRRVTLRRPLTAAHDTD